MKMLDAREVVRITIMLSERMEHFQQECATLPRRSIEAEHARHGIKAIHIMSNVLLGMTKRPPLKNLVDVDTQARLMSLARTRRRR